jgi:hypothetical protein
LLGIDYRRMHATSLKPRQVEALLAEHWQARSLSAETVKYRTVKFRWWVEKIGNGRTRCQQTRRPEILVKSPWRATIEPNGGSVGE